MWSFFKSITKQEYNWFGKHNISSSKFHPPNIPSSQKESVIISETFCKLITIIQRKNNNHDTMKNICPQ